MAQLNCSLGCTDGNNKFSCTCKGSLDTLTSCRHLQILFCELITTTEASTCRQPKSRDMNPISDTCIARIKVYEEKYRKIPSPHAHSLT